MWKEVGNKVCKHIYVIKDEWAICWFDTVLQQFILVTTEHLFRNKVEGPEEKNIFSVERTYALGG